MKTRMLSVGIVGFLITAGCNTASVEPSPSIIPDKPIRITAKAQEPAPPEPAAQPVMEVMSANDEPIMEVMGAGPYDHLFDPMPLRVGTQGAVYYHRPFSPRVQQSLIEHGEVKRINFYALSEINASGRIPAPDSFADVFACPTDPVRFATEGDELCLKSRKSPGIPSIDPANVVCFWGSYTLVIVPLENCTGGMVVTPEDMPIDMQFVYFNSIPSGIGDADNDGDVDDEDFLFLVECHSGPGVPASNNCQSCFDYDVDGDVDLDDFQLFLAEMGSSNADWIAANYPQATFLPERSIPLRVAVEGSILYHQPDCPAVLRSREDHGYHKFFEFYTREKILATTRSPDMVGPPNGCVATLQDWE